MKKSPLIPALIGILLVCALATLWLAYVNIQMSRKGRALQGWMNHINTTRLTLDALAKETIAYSQTNRAMDPILISVGLKPGQTATR
jgi:hypothetical protein